MEFNGGSYKVNLTGINKQVQGSDVSAAKESVLILKDLFWQLIDPHQLVLFFL